MATNTDLQIIQRPAETTAKARQWWIYLPEVSHDALEWCMAYEQFGVGISKRAPAVVHDLRRRKLKRAWRILEECRTDIKAIKMVAPRPVSTVVEVSYLSTLAYYYYHAAELNTARKVLERALSLIEETLSIAPFLVPCAGQCYDYRLHLARIARAESRWGEMFEQIQLGRRMVYGDLPLCTTVQGPIYLKDVCAFYGRATPLNEVEWETLQQLSDPRTIQREFHNLCVSATVVPFIVVDWFGN